MSFIPTNNDSKYIIFVFSHIGHGDNVKTTLEIWGYTNILSGLGDTMADALYRGDDTWFVVDAKTGEVVM